MQRPTYTTREEWLQHAAAALAPDVAELTGHAVPALRIACSFPHARGTASLRSGRVIGECWPPQLTSDGVHQLMVTPLDADPVATLATLAHEILHAAVGCDHGHDAVFSRAARALGLDGKPTATIAGPDFSAWAEGFVRWLGPYPHAAITLDRVADPKEPRNPDGPRIPAPRPPDSPRKQDARMMRCQCGSCGYLARVSRMWLRTAGTPLCPCGAGAMATDYNPEGDA